VKNLKNKNALLTGGSRGLGPYIARALAREGVNIVLTARSKDTLESTAKDISSMGVKALAFQSDVTEPDSRIKLVDFVKEKLGSIDLLINNAGIEWVFSYVKLSSHEIENMIRTNLMAPMLLTRQILPHMIEQRSGHIVNMSSLGGKKGSPYSSIYAATKAGLIEWTAGIREEFRNTGISFSVICPGFVSEAGMFAVYNKSAPKITGESSPDQVADAVIKAIKKDKLETIVNPGLIFPMQLMDAIHPSIMTWVLRKAGVYEFYRKQALDNEKKLNS